MPTPLFAIGLRACRRIVIVLASCSVTVLTLADWTLVNNPEGELEMMNVVRDSFGNQIGTFVRYRPEEVFRLTKQRDHEKLPDALRWQVAPKAEVLDPPIYPYQHAAAGTNGAVTIRFIIDPDGRVRQSEIIAATAVEFAYSATAAVEAWHFKPATRNGEPCHAAVQLEMRFDALDGENAVSLSEQSRRILRAQDGDGKVVRDLDKTEARPELVTHRQPVYPASRLRTGEPGFVELEVLIDRRGFVQLPRIVEASAADFGYSAVHAVARWRFKPLKNAAKPALIRVRIPIEYNPTPGPGK